MMLKYISPNRGLEGVKLIDPILPITTPYYTAHIPVWHDTIKSSALELSEWEKEWRDEEAAGEVVRAVGAWVVVVQKPVLGNGEGDLTQIRQILTTISALLTHHESSSSYAPDPNLDPLLLVVGMHQPLSPRLELSDEAWDDVGRECGGWEWIDGEKQSGGRNELGEKTGLARLLEALEANDWTSASTSTSSPLLSPSSSTRRSLSPPSPTKPLETRGPGTSTSGIAGSKEPLLGPPDIDEANERGERKKAEVGRREMKEDDEVEDEDEDEDRPKKGAGAADEEEEEEESESQQVENLDVLMSKMLAIRDQSADMPEAERRRFAARAVKGIMKDF